ncbi:hypothetical protein [Sphingobacterium faecale]|uniref:Ricin-type beta-trefoil lectin protein n=1 Tax=Sphingobacterium faecale TaxID=2803775 RepID=A0ABS1R6V5_9SPHI|nr:hypothetical protein [Sphingobacterium faecale]MBL1410434.1 hypothetical protein [Sphingobacterium faecale]
MNKLIKQSLFAIIAVSLTSCSSIQQAARTVDNSGVLIPPSSSGTARKTAGSGVTNTTKINAGTFYIINVGSQKALTNPKKEKFTKLRLNDFDGSNLQKWEVIQAKNGTVQLKMYDTPNWYIYFSNSVWLSVNSEGAENFTLKPAAGTNNKFHLASSTYGGKVLIWDGDNSYNGTQTAVLQNNKFDQWELVPAR